MSKTYRQGIEGYWRYINRGEMPSYSGVYFVCIGTYDKNNNTVTLKRLIYIGTGDDINSRIAGHERESDWKRYLKSGEELCFSCTEVDNSNRERVEAAYIYKHQPPANTSCKSSFNYDTTKIISTGKTILITTDFTVD
jgi:excinuclease UvrABC nuclease subunit